MTKLPPTTLFALVLAAAATLGAWAMLNRPVDLPDFRGDVAGLAWSPYQRGQSPEAGSAPTDAQMRRDLEVAACITHRIRTYTVAGGQAHVPALAAGLNLRITLGAWLDRRPAANAQELDRLIETTRANGNVDRVLVGNETLLRTDLTMRQLTAAIAQVKAAVHVPVSTAEPWHIWLKYPQLAQSVDFITIHVLPYWEGLPIDDALRFTMEKLDAVQAAYPGKPVVVGEIGWPSGGVAIGGARASRVNQAAFLRRFFQQAADRHIDYFAMEAFDQPWKTSFEGRAAGYWGLFDLNRRPKWPMAGAVVETPGWPLWAGLGTLTAAALTALLLSWRPDMALRGKLAFAALIQGAMAAFACVPMTMGETYLSASAAAVWAGLAVAQMLLLALLAADSFELAEILWGRNSEVPPPCPDPASRPKISIHVPICNEPPAMVRQTLDALAALDYPAFEVLVIDNNTHRPALWEPVAEHCARLGARFRFFHLGAHPGFKAGALNFALAHTAADAGLIGVLDSDYVVDHDWLRCMAPHFADPRVGFVQSPQDYRDGGVSAFKRMMFWEYAGFFRLGMVTRNARNAIVQHGTMTLVRRAALEAAAMPWAEWTICEDAELGLRLFRQGWRSVYSPRSFGRGLMPDDFAGYRRQRFRWAFGAVQICRRHADALFDPFNRELTLGQRWHFVTGWLPWLGDALGLMFLVLGLAWSVALIAAPVRTEFPLALFALPSIGLFAFRVVRTLSLYASRVPCGWADRLGAVVAGLALSHTIGRAVWRGVAVSAAPFRCTPKLKRAPALMQGVAMARQELALLALGWAAVAGVAAVHGLAPWESRLWCAMLFVQSLPCLAAVAVSVMAALPGRDPATIRMDVPLAAGTSVRSRA